MVVQGFGAVGWHAARLLAERGAAIIAISDSQGATWNPGGLDVAALRAHKLSAGQVAGFAGGVICAAAEYRGAGRAEAFTEITEKIRDSTAELLDRLRSAPLTPRAAADQIAHERLRQAAALRRKF